MNITTRIKTAIRDIPDFPKKGIIFKDITPVLADAGLFSASIDLLAEAVRGRRIDRIACIESRGFVFGAPLALRLGVGVIPVRKKGKLPYRTVSCTYQLEYGTDTLEMHADAVTPGDHILLVDDLLATGGTARATADMLRAQGADVVGVATLIELSFLKGREALAGYDVITGIVY